MTDWSKILHDPEQINLDLGNGHALSWTVAGENDDARIGAVVYHLTDKTESGFCCGAIRWASSTWEKEHPDRLTDAERRRPRWELQGSADEHITLSPSLLCSCGDHGYIRDGKWVPA